MNYIAFSLFGDEPKYLVGAFRNLVLAEQFYPGWKCVFYVQYNPRVITALSAGEAIIKDMTESKMGGYYWRHCLPADFEDVEAYIVRDCDSRISPREVTAVQQWIASPKTYHIMRDHPKHAHTLMQGMYGAKGRGLSVFKEWLAESPNIRSGAIDVFQRAYDQIIKLDVMEHGEFNLDSFPNQIHFPTQRENGRFVGEIFDEYDQPNDDWKEIPA